MNDISELSDRAKNFKPGIYKHFKGDLYQAFFVGRNSEDRGQEFVVYKSLKKGFIWIRPLAMFLENVDQDGCRVPRFSFTEESN